MNRTTLFLSSAALLLVAALVVGLPQGNHLPAPLQNPQPQPQPQPPPSTPVAPPVQLGGALSMTGRLSHPFITPGVSDVFATLEVAAVDVPGARRAPVNLALVIDRSGSMAGAKIQQARLAALRLVDLLDEHDRLALVHFGTDVRTVDGLFATPENKDRLRRAIRLLTEAGGTNIGEGLAAGKAQLDVARRDFRVNRLLLLSDGQPTVGLTSVTGLASLVATLRQSGLTVTSLGVGADFNEDLMQRLADVGGGSYGFISDAAATADLFERDLKQAGTMVARAVSVSFTLPEGVRFVEVYGRPVASVDASGRQVSLTLPDFSAAQREKLVVHLTTNVAERTGAIDIGHFNLAWDDLLASRAGEARVALAAVITPDATVARASRDKATVVAVAKAQAAANYRQAADAIATDDFAAARLVMEKNDGLLRDAEAVAGEEAVADERAHNKLLFGLSENAPSAAPEVRRQTVKQMKVQSRKSSGSGASVY